MTTPGTVVDALPAHLREVFREVIGQHDPDLLIRLLMSPQPAMDDREKVHEILSTEFSHHLGPGHEPTARGVAIDDALGKFLDRWPLELG